MSTPKLYGRDRVTLQAVLSRLRELGFQPTVESARGGGSHMKVRWGPPSRVMIVGRYTDWLRLDSEGLPYILKRLAVLVGNVWASWYKGLPTGPRSRAIEAMGFVCRKPWLAQSTPLYLLGDHRD